MQALYDMGGQTVALDKIFLIGPIQKITHPTATEIMAYNLLRPNDSVFIFEVHFSGAKKPYKFGNNKLDLIKEKRQSLVDAVNAFQAEYRPQEKAPLAGPIEGLTTGEKCAIYRRRASLSLSAAGAAVWPDYKAGHAKLKKIEAGHQKATKEELARLSEIYKAPAMVDLFQPIATGRDSGREN